MTSQDEVTAWMESLGFTWRMVSEIKDNYAWCKNLGEDSTCLIYPKEAAFFHAAQQKAVLEGQIEENQKRLDRINNYNPKPGELTAASFGSAGAAMETTGWKHSFENRIAELKSQLTNLEKGQTE